MGLAARNTEGDRLMPDDAASSGKPEAPRQGFATRMSHGGRAGTRVHGFVNPPADAIASLV